MIDIKNLTVKFDEKIVFQNYSLIIPNNEIYCIVGRSGCGKSTLLRVISGLLKPQQGVCTVNGKRIIKPTHEVGMVFQRYENFPWLRALDNTLFPIKMRRKVVNEDVERAKHILSIFGLGDEFNKFPHELSGGMNQRLALAAVILQDPSTLLMDEPLSALDPENREFLQNFILDFNKDNKRQILIVTHSIQEANKLTNFNNSRIIRM